MYTSGENCPTGFSSEWLVLTSSCAVPRSSITIDWVREMWTPMSRWTPQHSRQTRTPRLTDSHSGSVTNNTHVHTCFKHFKLWESPSEHYLLIQLASIKQQRTGKTQWEKVKVVTRCSTITASPVAWKLSDLLQYGSRELLHTLIVWTKLRARCVAKGFHQHLLLCIVQHRDPPTAQHQNTVTVVMMKTLCCGRIAHRSCRYAYVMLG